MTNFSTSAQIKTSTKNALRVAVDTLTNNGFRIVHYDESSASLTGPGLKSTRQNPLLGATKISLKLDDQKLSLDAELGGVDSMQKFLMRFPFILGLTLGLLFGVVGGFAFGQQFRVGFGVPWAQGWTWMLLAVAGSMLPVSPWLVLSPIMSNQIRSRTENALVTMTQNAVLMPEP